MITGHVRAMQQTDPRKVAVVYERKRWSEIFDHNPRIAKPGEKGDFQILYGRINGLRAYTASKSPERWIWKDAPPPVGEIYLTTDETRFGKHFPRHVIIEPNVKSRASPNKDWGIERWTALVKLMRAEGIVPVQLGPPGTRLVKGAEFIQTLTFRLACSMMRRALAAVLSEGALHHAAAAFGVKAVVIFGGYISPRQTGYDMHVNLFTGGEPCGWRTPCTHCAEAMAKITPEEVMEELRRLL